MFKFIIYKLFKIVLAELLEQVLRDVIINYIN